MVTLFMPVGLLMPDKETGRSSLAHGLAYSIDQHRPSKVIFFVSEKSKETVKLIKDEYQNMADSAFPPHELVEVREIDNIAACIEVMDGAVRSVEGRKRIDYTSGTKSMTAAAAIVAILHHIPPYIVEAERGGNYIGIAGTERVREQALFPVYDRTLYRKAVEDFNTYRFESAIRTIEETVVLPEKEQLLKIFRGYAAWDRFDHAGAFAILGDLNDERISKNKGFLGSLLNMKDEKLKAAMLLADLLANAARRIEEHKYDDATARLYRAVELVAQIRLLEYGVDDISKNPRVDDLKTCLSPAQLEEYRGKAEDNGVLRLGVQEKYALLEDMGCAEAEGEYGAIRGFLTKRNVSILAHGLTPVGKEFVSEFYDHVLALAESACGPVGFRKKCEMATFARL